MKMKRLSLLFAITIAALLLTACADSSSYEKGYDEGYSEGYHDAERNAEDIEPADVIDWFFDTYTTREIIEMGYGSYFELGERIGAPNILLVVEECISQGHPEYVQKLMEICDSIGYSASALFGQYFADSNYCIHKTDGPCLDNIEPEDLIMIGPYGSVNDILSDMQEYEAFKQHYTICEICCDN